MTRSPLVVACVVAGVAVQAACAAKARPTAPAASTTSAPSGAAEVVALLPDTDGTVGRATVSNVAGVITLEGARASTRVVHLDAPAPVAVLSEDDVERLFGEVLAGCRRRRNASTLYFRFESDRLTAESEALVAEHPSRRRQRPGARGRRRRPHRYHRTPPSATDDLGLRRAHMVRDILVARASGRPRSRSRRTAKPIPLVQDRRQRRSKPAIGASTSRSDDAPATAGSSCSAAWLPTLVAAVVCLCQPPSVVSLGPPGSTTACSVRAVPTTPPTGRVVIVDVDERSLTAVGQWPWPRDAIAGLIDRSSAIWAPTRSRSTSCSRSRSATGDGSQSRT